MSHTHGRQPTDDELEDAAEDEMNRVDDDAADRMADDEADWGLPGAMVTTTLLLVAIGWFLLSALAGWIICGGITRVRNDCWRMYSTPMGTGWEVGVRRRVDDEDQHISLGWWDQPPDRGELRAAEREAVDTADELNVGEDAPWAT